MDLKFDFDVQGMPLTLPDHRLHHWQDVLEGMLSEEPEGSVDIDCGEWFLTCSDLDLLLNRVNQGPRRLGRVISRIPQTVVSASALGLDAILRDPADMEKSDSTESRQGMAEGRALIHQGTLRAGDHLHSDRDILLHGDVNPGARISAVGDVLVWGRLRGVAHAGCEGANDARIVALQLRPLQLRISDAVARGPEDVPQQGLAEQAILRDGVITIEPAEIIGPVRR